MGGCDSLLEAGAPGAKREPDRAKPQLVVSSAKRCAGLTTPAAPLRWLRNIFLMAQPPLLCEEGNALHPYVTVITKSTTKFGGNFLLPAKRIFFEPQNPACRVSGELLGMRYDDLCHAFTIEFAHDIEHLVDEPGIQL